MSFWSFFSRRDPLEDALKQAAIDPQVYSAAIAARVTDALLKERRHERGWVWVRRAGYSALAVMAFYFYFAQQQSRMGWQPLPKGDLVAVVKIHGNIATGELASSDQIGPALIRAYENPSVKAIVLDVDSGGGAPVEAERINTIIDLQSKKHPKPIWAVISNTGASAAYMIAMHTDRLVAARYSAVGSIGAVMMGWNVSRALARLDVEQRVYASGKLKGAFNPFTPSTEAADAKAQDLVSIMGRRFAAELQQRRGKLLKAGVTFDTGEIWDGETSLALGLIDEIGTLETAASKLAPNAKVTDFGPNARGGGLFGMSFEEVGAKLADGAIGRLIKLQADQTSVQVR